MSLFSSEPYARRTTRNAQVITIALMTGLATFAAIVMVLSLSQGQNAPAQPPAAPANLPIVSLLAVIFSVGVLGAREVIVPQMVKQWRRRIAAGQGAPVGGMSGGIRLPETANDADQLLALFVMQHILKGAMAEGPALFALISFMVERQWWVLIVPFVSLALLAMAFPTRGAVERSVQHQLELTSLEQT
jgi:hypothetical protein